MILGCIADDLTGATDLSLMLTSEGMRTVQMTGLPDGSLEVGDADAVVIAMKTRSIRAEDAVQLSLQATRLLEAAGARQFLFKYCSTFDSTDQGNIGPVAEALLDELGGAATVFCPAFPIAGRTVYMGHLFVGDELLSDSPMKNHPLNPMRDANLCRVLARQAGRAVGLVRQPAIVKGAGAIKTALAEEAEAGRSLVVVDALSDADLRNIGGAIIDLPLITGGSGVAMGLPRAYVNAGWMERLTPPPETMQAPEGRRAILAGSCSQATRAQIKAALGAGLPALRIDVRQLGENHQSPHTALDWVDAQPVGQPILIYSSTDPPVVEEIHRRFGREASGRMAEEAMATIARGLAQRGFASFLVAGGETSGAVVEALGVRALAIGPEIDPGVPWTRSTAGPDLALALKSGNFGDPDFFTKAWDRLVDAGTPRRRNRFEGETYGIQNAWPQRPQGFGYHDGYIHIRRRGNVRGGRQPKRQGGRTPGEPVHR